MISQGHRIKTSTRDSDPAPPSTRPRLKSEPLQIRDNLTLRPSFPRAKISTPRIPLLRHRPVGRKPVPLPTDTRSVRTAEAQGSGICLGPAGRPSQVGSSQDTHQPSHLFMGNLAATSPNSSDSSLPPSTPGGALDITSQVPLSDLSHFFPSA